MIVNTNQGDQSIPAIASGGYEWVNLPAGTTTINYTEATGGPGYEVSSLAAVESDGVLLIDANIQDTVLDKPMMDFAVLSGNNTEDTYFNGNLQLTTPGSGYGTTTVNQDIPTTTSGKYYWEVTVGEITDSGSEIGIVNTPNPSNSVGIGGQNSQDASFIGFSMLQSGYKYSGSTAEYGSPYSQGDVVGIMLDLDSTSISFSINGVDQGVAFNNVPIAVWYPALSDASNSAALTGTTINLGQQPFAYADNSNLDVGKVTVGGVQYRTLFQLAAPIYPVFGSLFFDERQGRAITASELRNKYGLLPRADNARKIFELTEQPTHEVSHYIKSGNKYVPQRAYRSAMATLLQQLKANAKAWAQAESYTEGQIVSYNGNYYVALESFSVAGGGSFTTDKLQLINEHGL